MSQPSFVIANAAALPHHPEQEDALKMTMFPKMTYRQIAAQYVDSRRTLATPISTKHALQALKSAMPDCVLSDQELVALVAELAVERGRSVDFDIRAERSNGK